MPNSIIAEGKTTNEAIENGLKELRVPRNQVDVKVLDKDDKRSFFSILTPRVVKVELTVKENLEKSINNAPKSVIREPKVYSADDLEKAETAVKSFLPDFLKNIGEDAHFEISKNENGINVNITGDSASILIGYRGETLYAIQNVLSAIASKGLHTHIRVLVDVSGYREKREKTLEDLAEKVARTVIRTGKSVTLEPMKPYERKIIHSKLQNSRKVTTNSIGEEPRRRIVISLIK